MSQCGLGFHILRGGIDPRAHRFRPRLVEVVDIWKNFLSGGTLSSPGGAGSRLKLGLWLLGKASRLWCGIGQWVELELGSKIPLYTLRYKGSNSAAFMDGGDHLGIVGHA